MIELPSVAFAKMRLAAYLSVSPAFRDRPMEEFAAELGVPVDQLVEWADEPEVAAAINENRRATRLQLLPRTLNIGVQALRSGDVEVITKVLRLIGHIDEQTGEWLDTPLTRAIGELLSRKAAAVDANPAARLAS